MGKMRKPSCMSICSAAACRRDSCLHSSASQGVPLLCDAATHQRRGCRGQTQKRVACLQIQMYLPAFAPSWIFAWPCEFLQGLHSPNF